MSEEEILKECTELAENEHHELGNCWDEEYSSSAIFGLIMLYKQTKKELNSLKEIEQLHQEENGKLRVELEQYKLLEANIDKANKIIAENKFDEGLYGLLMQEKEKNKELEEQINLNKKTVEIAQTQILEYSQGYKDGLNKETTATAIVARELELNFIRQEIKHKYISKDKIREIVIPTPDNPISLEIQQSEFYAKILKVVAES